LIAKRKRMLDCVGHYSRPDIFTLLIDREARAQVRPKGTPSIEDEADNAEIIYRSNDRVPSVAPQEEPMPAR
jgi:hypothetical protein